MTTPDTTVIDQAPAAVGSASGSYSGADTFFSTDFSNCSTNRMHKIAGVNTLGVPGPHGYGFNFECCSENLYFQSQSGFNYGQDGPENRTMASGKHIKVAQLGQGDCVAHFIDGYCNTSNPYSVSWATAPAISALVVDLNATAPQCYLNPIEVHIADNGHDCAGVVYQGSMRRSYAGTPTMGNSWGAICPQSLGPIPVDFFVSMQGPAKMGVDFTSLDSQDGAAVVMREGQRIYGNGVKRTGVSPYWLYPDQIGNDSLGFESGEWTVRNNGQKTFGTTPDKVIAYRMIEAAAGIRRKPTMVTTAEYTVLPTDTQLIIAHAGPVTLTLIDALLEPCELDIKTVTNDPVYSSASNFYPLEGGDKGSVILPAGKRWISISAIDISWIGMKGD